MSFVYESNDASMIDSIMNRGEYSYPAARALLEHLQGLAEGSGEPIELDPAELRGQFAEYETVWEMVLDMGWGDHVVQEDGEFDLEETLENIGRHGRCTIFRVSDDGPFLVSGG
jgi:hypothetical protein